MKRFGCASRVIRMMSGSSTTIKTSSESPATRNRTFLFYTALVNEKVRLRVAGDSDDVFIVVLDPALNFLTVDQLYNDRGPAFREAVNVLGLAKSLFRRGLPPVSAADVFGWCSYCHVSEDSGFDVKISEWRSKHSSF